MIRYFAVLLILVILRSTLSGQGFFFDYPNIKEYNTNHDIPFNCRINTEEIIYILNSRDLKNGPDEDCGTYIIQRKNNGEIISKIDLSNDTLKGLCAYGNKIGDKIQTFCFAKSSNDIYLIYRLFNDRLEVEDYHISYVNTYNLEMYYSLNVYLEQFRATDANQHYLVLTYINFINNSAVSESVGMVFDNLGHFVSFKKLAKSLNSFETDALLYNTFTKNLEYILKDYRKIVFDTNFNFIKEIDIGTYFQTKNDTMFSIWNSILQHENKIIRFGKTQLSYNIDSETSFYSISGRGLSEIDNNMKVSGKIAMSQFAMSTESDGVARFSNSIFFRNNHYYTIFEFQEGSLPLPSPNTFYITKFDTLYNIVEETYFVVNGEYRFFVEWVDFSDDLLFTISGFYYETDTDDGEVTGGGYLLGLNYDGSQPSLKIDQSFLQAVIKVQGNPTSDYLVLSGEVSKKINYDVKIFDINGKLLKVVKNWNGDTLSIPVHEYNRGTYIYQVLQQDKSFISGKFIKI